MFWGAWAAHREPPGLPPALHTHTHSYPACALSRAANHTRPDCLPKNVRLGPSNYIPLGMVSGEERQEKVPGAFDKEGFHPSLISYR